MDEPVGRRGESSTSAPTAGLPCSSLAEEIAMRPCAFETDRIFAGRVYENPVGFDMYVATRSPLALQRVVAQFGGKAPPATRSAITLRSFSKSLPRLREFDIAFELAGE
jgi:hypothetical protein